MDDHAAFLALPAKLYPKGSNPRNAATESELLAGTHTLSRYFEIHTCTVAQKGKTQARCAVTIYPDDNTAYLGFFDSIADAQVARELFGAAENYLLGRGLHHIVGPVDASFWLGYRLKANRFNDAPYFGEPGGLPWYQGLWEQNGYAVTDVYHSHLFKAPSQKYVNQKYTDRLASFLEQGYRIESPSSKSWDKVIGEVYELIMSLYHDFPVFKMIGEDDFRKHYSGLRQIMNFSMVKMAYYQDRAVGFYISVPDYGHLLNQPVNPAGLARIFWIKRHAPRYVMLYMGVDQQHRGLGKAIAQTIIDQVNLKKALTIGALIHTGKDTERYVDDMIDERYRYLLFEKRLV